MADLISAPYAPTQLVFRYSFARFIVPIEWYDGANPFPIPENWDIRFAKLTGNTETPLQEIWNDPDQTTRPQSPRDAGRLYHARSRQRPRLQPRDYVPQRCGRDLSAAVSGHQNGCVDDFQLRTRSGRCRNHPVQLKRRHPFVETAIGASAAEQRLVALESQVVALQSGGVMEVGSLAETQEAAAEATGIRFYGDTTNGKAYIYLNGINKLFEIVTKQKPLS